MSKETSFKPLNAAPADTHKHHQQSQPKVYYLISFTALYQTFGDSFRSKITFIEMYLITLDCVWSLLNITCLERTRVFVCVCERAYVCVSKNYTVYLTTPLSCNLHQIRKYKEGFPVLPPPVSHPCLPLHAPSLPPSILPPPSVSWFLSLLANK